MATSLNLFQYRAINVSFLANSSLEKITPNRIFKKKRGFVFQIISVKNNWLIEFNAISIVNEKH